MKTMNETQKRIETEIESRRERVSHLRAAQAAIESAIMDYESEIARLTDEHSQAARDEAEGME